MKLLNFGKKEERTDTDLSMVNDVLLRALLGGNEIAKEVALEIPSVQASVSYIANTVSSLPIKMYEKNGDVIREITEDSRIRLLNKDTNDTMTSKQFWKSIIEDYYLGRGGFAYIDKSLNAYKRLCYVDEKDVSIMKNSDPIFKQYEINVGGKRFYPYEFFKIFRKTKDGCTNNSIIDENSLILALAYYSLKYENTLVRKGGNKRGFLKSENKLSKDAVDELKSSFKNLYSNNTENVMVLNKGLDFQETSNTSVEMQLNEQKLTNSAEISMLFNVPNSIIRGNASEQDKKNFINFCITPLLNDIECSLNRDLLLESEKSNRYFSFYTKELTRGTIKERYEAYKLAVDAGFITKNEIRRDEDLKDIDGLDIVAMSLANVIYDANTGKYFVPNTKQVTDGKGVTE